ncbi:ABC transporter ATP-binding protein [bacterium]|nr:ABC transporter ATP-binding protein [bacterium]
MTIPIISVENLSKAYRMGAKEEVPDTLFGAVKNIAYAPLRNLRKLQNLNTTNAQLKPADSGDGSCDTDPEILWALQNVNFEVNEGDVVGIIGRNGAGKSTLLKILSRITSPTGGKAIIKGRVSSLLEVGTGFHPELTGRENIYMNGTILGMTKREIDRKFDEIVDFSGVERFLDTPTKRYSSGMQVRLAFAVAAHLEPEVLVVDEVLAVGDLQFQRKCINKMQAISSQGRTVLFVSHNMGAIESLCTRLIGLSNHTVTIDSTVSQGLDWYLKMPLTSAKPADRKDREGSGQTRLLDVAISPANEERSVIQMGDALRITLQVTASKPANVDFGIALHDEYGARLMRLNASDMAIAPLPVSQHTQITCITKPLNLLPGNYGISTGISDHTGVHDLLQQAHRFEIHPSKVFPSGAVPNAKNAKFFSLSHWDSVEKSP